MFQVCFGIFSCLGTFWSIVEIMEPFRAYRLETHRCARNQKSKLIFEGSVDRHLHECSQHQCEFADRKYFKNCKFGPKVSTNYKKTSERVLTHLFYFIFTAIEKAKILLFLKRFLERGS